MNKIKAFFSLIIGLIITTAVINYPVILGAVLGVGISYYIFRRVRSPSSDEEETMSAIEQAKKEYAEGKLTEEEYETRLEFALQQEQNESNAEKELDEVLLDE